MELTSTDTTLRTLVRIAPPLDAEAEPMQEETNPAQVAARFGRLVAGADDWQSAFFLAAHAQG